MGFSFRIKDGLHFGGTGPSAKLRLFPIWWLARLGTQAANGLCRDASADPTQLSYQLVTVRYKAKLAEKFPGNSLQVVSGKLSSL